MSKSEICALFDVPEDLVDVVGEHTAEISALAEANEKWCAELMRQWVQLRLELLAKEGKS